jgi:hypothetical protein
MSTALLHPLALLVAALVDDRRSGQLGLYVSVAVIAAACPYLHESGVAIRFYFALVIA